MSQTVDFEVNDNHAIVNSIKSSKVSQLFVEFLQQGGPKLHVVLRLNITPPVKTKGDTWTGCRLAMDLVGDYDRVFHITPLRYESTSHSADAAFEFKFTTQWTVGQIIDVITQPQAYLLDFTFTGGFKQPGSNIEYFDGCRDFISQVFIPLHRWKVVDWHVHKIHKGSFSPRNLDIIPDKTGFHEIIGYNYKNATTGTIVESLPLARGSFGQNFRRTVVYENQIHLPYKPASLQSGDDGYTPPTYNLQSSATYNLQSHTTSSSSQQTLQSSVWQGYPTAWEWSKEHNSWWRYTSPTDHEWSTPSESSATQKSTSDVGQSSQAQVSSQVLEGHVTSLKDHGSTLVCKLSDGTTKSLRRSVFHPVAEKNCHVNIGKSGTEYRLESLEPEGKGKGKVKVKKQGCKW